MRGRVLTYDFRSASGFISGDDNQRYSFKATEWRSDNQPIVGHYVDFEADGNEALAVYQVSALGVGSNEKNRVTAALLAIFLGGLGIHKFYLGKNQAGIVMLLVSLFGAILLFIPTFIIGVIAFVEFIIYLTATDEDFQLRYVQGDKSWF